MLVIFLVLRTMVRPKSGSLSLREHWTMLRARVAAVGGILHHPSLILLLSGMLILRDQTGTKPQLSSLVDHSRHHSAGEWRMTCLLRSLVLIGDSVSVIGQYLVIGLVTMIQAWNGVIGQVTVHLVRGRVIILLVAVQVIIPLVPDQATIRPVGGRVTIRGVRGRVISLDGAQMKIICPGIHPVQSCIHRCPTVHTNHQLKMHTPFLGIQDTL